ncbi:tannase/feruloyl esterase family alpha/beta hydrolase [Streptomyces sp. H49]|uniref:tannase/feruloyl esterase family alpha/beta hydrolase n=1 Tax=Streptomyces sp. H49 TaxID=3444117 RepID=UPI003F4A88AA
MFDHIRGPRRRARRPAWPSRLALIALLVAVLPATTLTAAGAAGRSAAPDSSVSRCSTGYVTSALRLSHVTVSSAVLDTTGSYTPPGSTTLITGLPGFCAVDLTQTDSAGNSIHIAVWLPTNWNGRFQGIGGGGYSCGIVYASTPQYVNPSLEQTLKSGYATASTDCGVPVADQFTGSWALKPDGRLDKPLITDFASAGIHDMTVAGKAVTQAFYSNKIQYSYFNGCSTGGREGLMEAQQYPADYNGIVSGAPAVNWTSSVPAAIWPALVMNRMHDALPTCKQDAFIQAVVKACDAHDGVTDGIIGDPAACHWNADKLIGLSTPCGTITATDAAVMNKIWQGPVTTDGRSLWWGLQRGASTSMIAATTTTNGVTTPQPFGIPVGWLGTWLQQNPNWDWKTLTFAQFNKLFAQSVRQFSSTLATNNPDLSAFRGNGGKILVWHGLADQLLPPQSTIQYYQNVQHAMGGAAKTNSFARLFLAPGAAHCAGAAGPAPTDPLAAMVKWVEHGQAPQSIPATLTNPDTGAATLSRPLCSYPLVARYTGHGNTDQARNFTCARALSR